ncbi:GAF and ANTAR domain-containing protein [Streptomyces sp. NPDC047002]|uniref:GAF and ANTAR domain-containing protein n=1 Tax=Streptomyces sp. NPDC047002 TaxID=3155475 RepID=UPI0034553527
MAPRRRDESPRESAGPAACGSSGPGAPRPQDSAAGADSELPARLCRACVELLDVTGASVSLDAGGGARTTWWSSDEVAGRLAEAQYTLGDGPCGAALRMCAPVLAPDLAQGPDAHRWPVFAHCAVRLGVRAVFTLPLGSEAAAIGTLDLYRSRPGPLSEHDLALAFPAADAITDALVLLSSSSPAGRRAADGLDTLEWLREAETQHEEVHHATGMLMVRWGVPADEALARLRAHAFAQGTTVTQAARAVVEKRDGLGH